MKIINLAVSFEQNLKTRTVNIFSYEIIRENDKNMVVDDENFTTIRKVEDGSVIAPLINDVSINEYKGVDQKWMGAYSVRGWFQTDDVEHAKDAFTSKIKQFMAEKFAPFKADFNVLIDWGMANE